MINFIKYRFISISIGFIACTFIIFKLIISGLNYGIDLTGGVSIQINGTKEEFKKYNPVQIKEDLYMIKCAEEDIEKFDQDKIQSMKVIGAKSIDIVNNFKYAIIYALLAIAIYIWIKFNLTFSIISTIALLHDVIIILGYYILTRNEINEISIIAFLSTVAYSINDTVVIFDHIRENELNIENINYSLNRTLKRTLYTSITTALALIALSLLGGYSISELSIPMLIGLIAGTYSSIFIAGPLLSYFV